VGDDVAIGDVARDGDLERDGARVGTTLLLAELGQRPGIVEAALEDLGDGVEEDRLAVEIEQAVGEGGGVAQAAPGFDPAAVESVDGRDQGAQAVAAPRAGSKSKAPFNLWPYDQAPSGRGPEALPHHEP